MNAHDNLLLQYSKLRSIDLKFKKLLKRPSDFALSKKSEIKFAKAYANENLISKLRRERQSDLVNKLKIFFKIKNGI